MDRHLCRWVPLLHVETQASRLLLSVTLLSLGGFRVLLCSQWKRKEEVEKHLGNAICGGGGYRGEEWQLPLRDNPIVCGRVEVGGLYFGAQIFGIQMMSRLQ